MNAYVSEIHLICRRRTNVTNESAEQFDSGWWAIAKRHAQAGVPFALHETKDQPSYLQGEIMEVLAEEGGGSGGGRYRVQVRVRATAIPMPWKGGGSGEIGYLWAGADFTNLPVIPAEIGPTEAGGNGAVKSLLEAEKFSYPKLSDLEKYKEKGSAGQGRSRQEDFVRLIARIAVALEGSPIPYAFLDTASMPYRLDTGAVGRIIAAGYLELPKIGIDSRISEFRATDCLLRVGRRDFVSSARQDDNSDHDEDQNDTADGQEGGEGEDPDATSSEDVGQVQSAYDPFDDFDPASVSPEEFRQAVARRTEREGQSVFRRRLFDAYGGRCAVTGCEVAVALEAAHIIPHSLAGQRGMEVCNGVLLRADLHALFDAQLLGLRPVADGFALLLSPRLANTDYIEIDRRVLSRPADPMLRPSLRAVAIRMAALPVE